MKFFRPLRKNTNTNINYIKYAVGEVVLVVIGILIALQVIIQFKDEVVQPFIYFQF